MKIAFDVAEYYYLPQYEPVIGELYKRGIATVVLVPENICSLVQVYINKLAAASSIELVTYTDATQQEACLRAGMFDWVIFGNIFKRSSAIPQATKFALIQHGVGPKACYYDVSEGDFDIRFVEGQERLTKLQKRYPEKEFLDVGFVKMDPIIQKKTTLPKWSDLGLDENKKTLLYAPSFFPCSIECLPDDLPEMLSDFNVILKPHYFSLSREKFLKQKNKLEHWSEAKNAYLVPLQDTNILPYYALSDLMISDASSTVFEFIALDKPIIWFTQTQLRWSYRGVFSYRLKKRMDFDLRDYYSIGAVANNVTELIEKIHYEIKYPDNYASQRKRYCEKLIGVVDGNVSHRIVDYLQQ